MKDKRTCLVVSIKVLSTLFLVFCLNSIVWAKDFRQFFHVMSPEYANEIVFVREDIPFMISAPKGWYLASKKENVTGSDVGFFSKSDPNEPLSQGLYGSFGFPFIVIELFSNPSAMSASEVLEKTEESSRADGSTVLANEQIQADNNLGMRFAVKAPGEESISDTYIFTTEHVIFLITAQYKEAERESVQGEVKESIDSIKFRFTFE